MTMRLPLSLKAILTMGVLWTVTLPSSIIFDMNGVLVATNNLAGFWYTGPSALTRYFLTHPSMIKGASTKLRYQVLFPFLASINFSCPDGVLHSELPPAYDETGEQLPPLMVAWNAGKLNSEEARLLCHAALNDPERIFSSKAEHNLLQGMTSMMFTPSLLAATQKYLPHSHQFVRACKAAGHKVYILSNWDVESFELLQQAHPELFDLFDGIVISGTAGVTKPNKQIFDYLLTAYNLDPYDCFFIDDVEANIVAARECNIHGALCINNNPMSVLDALNAWIDNSYDVAVS